MNYDCQLLDVHAQPVLSIRMRTALENLPAMLGEGFAEVGQYLGELGVKPAGAPFVGYYNMDMHNLDIEVGFPLNETRPGKGRIQSGVLPAGRRVECLYVGPYKDCQPAYEAIDVFMKERGLEPATVMYEQYLNSPIDTPQEQLQTLIIYPIK